MKTLKPIIEDLRLRNSAIQKLQAVRDQAAKKLPDVTDKLSKLPDHEKALRKLALDVSSGLASAADGAKREARLRAEGLETAKQSAALKAAKAELETTIADADESISEQQQAVAKLTDEAKAALLNIVKGRLIDANAEYMASVSAMREKYHAAHALSRVHWHLCGESFAENTNLTASKDRLSGIRVSGVDGLVSTPEGLFAFEIGAESRALLDATTATLAELQNQYPELM